MSIFKKKEDVQPQIAMVKATSQMTPMESVQADLSNPKNRRRVKNIMGIPTALGGKRR